MTQRPDPQTFDAAKILAIGENDPEKLFGAPEDVTDTYRALAKKWHPDRNKDAQAADVLARLVALKKKADDKIARDVWQEPGAFTCRLTNGKKFRVHIDAVRPFELGTMYISPTTVTYVVKKDYADLFKNATNTITALNLPDPKLKKAYGNALPVTNKTYESDDALILTVRKRNDDVLLRDLMPLIPKEHLDRHTAWITSRLHEMARYLDYTGVAHNAITPDTVFVSPSGHTIGLFGGWWYARPFGATIPYAPAEAADYIDTSTGAPIAGRRTDLEMVKAVSREMLGDRIGTRLPMLKTAPEPVISFLRTPSSGDAQQDLVAWYQQVLPKSFGARRFTELKVSYSDIYQPGS